MDVANIPYDRSAGRLLKVAEVAKKLNCSESWVRELCRQGRLRKINIGNNGRGVRIVGNSILSYLRKLADEEGHLMQNVLW